MDQFLDSRSLLGSLQEAFSSAMSASLSASAAPGPTAVHGSLAGRTGGTGAGAGAGPAGGGDLGDILAMCDLAASIREVRCWGSLLVLVLAATCTFPCHLRCVGCYLTRRRLRLAADGWRAAQALDRPTGPVVLTISGKNAAGQCQALYAFGGRSFSIWDAEGRQVYDSGDALERITRDAAAALAADPDSPYAFRFNTSHDNDSLDGRSPTKGPEPEGVVIGTFGGRSFAFVGLERVGGIAVFDISDPAAPVFADYLNTRNGLTGDRGPEGLALVKAEDSPTGEPLLIVGHEVSGTTVVYRIALRY